MRLARLRCICSATHDDEMPVEASRRGVVEVVAKERRPSESLIPWQEKESRSRSSRFRSVNETVDGFLDLVPRLVPQYLLYREPADARITQHFGQRVRIMNGGAELRERWIVVHGGDDEQRGARAHGAGRMPLDPQVDQLAVRSTEHTADLQHIPVQLQPHAAWPRAGQPPLQRVDERLERVR
ncbi:MAG: hypothetical protein ACRD0K_04000 [Egibacteraceae bacterium]